MKLSLYNTLTRKIEKFQPINDQLVKMYVCGPTVYDYPHIGNARSIVVYDLLYRILIHKYGKNNVLYVRNITDVDDKIINRSKDKGLSISDLTKQTIQNFHEDISYLGCLTPNIEPKATEHIQDMIDIIQGLISNGCAYQSNNHVFFRVSRAEKYTELSGKSLDSLLEGVRIDVDKSKEHPGDFVLWKPARAEDPESANFDSPFGLGRPGWHIECSAMSHKYLGKNFDIHGGGVDLIFPHHTNEIAQSCCAYENSKYANFWVHNGFLTVNKRKMSKSLGNFITVQDIKKQGISGDVARLFLLSAHYHKPLDYNLKALEDAKKMLANWRRAINSSDLDLKSDHECNLPDDFISALFDDMNVSVAYRIMNEIAKSCQSDAAHARQLFECLRFLGLENIISDSLNKSENIDAINALIKEREVLKSKKRWKEADAIRDKLSAQNIVIEDTAEGKTLWRKK